MHTSMYRTHNIFLSIDLSCRVINTLSAGPAMLWNFFGSMDVLHIDFHLLVIKLYMTYMQSKYTILRINILDILNI